MLSARFDIKHFHGFRIYQSVFGMILSWLYDCFISIKELLRIRIKEFSSRSYLYIITPRQLPFIVSIK